MTDDQALKEWFCREVLPLERALSAFIRRNWRDAAVVVDLDAISGNDVLEPERQLLAREELLRIQLGLEKLPPRCREVVLLRKIRGLSTRETADELGIGIDTVEKQMTLGMRALANFMLGGSAKVQRSRVPGLLVRRPAR